MISYEKEIDTIKKKLDELDLRPSKRWGQNFLLDSDISSRIVKEIDKRYDGPVLEIGPGLGKLTDELVESGHSVICYELDSRLYSYLKKRYAQLLGKSVHLYNKDIMKDIKGLLGRDCYIVSNLPYSITSRFVGTVLDSKNCGKESDDRYFGSILMLQKDYIDRLISKSGCGTYGRISVLFQLKMDHELLMEVPSSSFFPRPAVDSSVIKFGIKKDNRLDKKEDAILRELLRVLFSQRRKKISNSIRDRKFHGIDGVILRKKIDEMGISEYRPEKISPEDYLELIDRMMKIENI